MKSVFQIDDEGFLIKAIAINEDDNIPNNCIEVHPQSKEKGGFFYKYKWDGEKWVEGMTQEEINQKNTLTTPTEIEMLRDYVLDLDYRLIMMELGI